MTAAHIPTITIRQPWASLITSGLKTIETRPQRTHHRGWVAIHAAATNQGWLDSGLTGWRHTDDSGPWHSIFGCDPDQVPGIVLTDDGYSERWIARADPAEWHRGAVVGTARIVDCLPIVQGADEWGVWPDETPEPPYVDNSATLWVQGDSTWSAFGHHTNQLPLGDFTPGRFAWMLEDAKPTTERCPVCLGEGWVSDCTGYGEGWHQGDHGDCSESGCPHCWQSAASTLPAGKSFPIPAKGSPALPWRWRP